MTIGIMNFSQISRLSHFSKTKKQKKMCHVVAATSLLVPSQPPLCCSTQKQKHTTLIGVFSHTPVK